MEGRAWRDEGGPHESPESPVWEGLGMRTKATEGRACRKLQRTGGGKDEAGRQKN